MMPRGLRGKLLIGLAMGAAVAVVLGLAADLPRLLGVLARFEWQLVPLILG